MTNFDANVHAHHLQIVKFNFSAECVFKVGNSMRKEWFYLLESPNEDGFIYLFENIGESPV